MYQYEVAFTITYTITLDTAHPDRALDMASDLAIEQYGEVFEREASRVLVSEREEYL